MCVCVWFFSPSLKIHCQFLPAYLARKRGGGGGGRGEGGVEKVFTIMLLVRIDFKSFPKVISLEG